MTAELTDRGIIRIEWVLRRQEESHTGSRQARDKSNKNGRRTGKLHKKPTGTQGQHECGG